PTVRRLAASLDMCRPPRGATRLFRPDQFHRDWDVQRTPGVGHCDEELRVGQRIRGGYRFDRVREVRPLGVRRQERAVAVDETADADAVLARDDADVATPRADQS